MNETIKAIKRKYFKDDNFYIFPKNIYGDMYLVYLANQIKEDDPDLYNMLLEDGKEAMRNILEDSNDKEIKCPKCVLTSKIDKLSFEECEDILNLIRFKEWKEGT